MAKAQKKPVKKQKSGPLQKMLVWPLNEKQSFWLAAGMIIMLTVTLFSSYLFGPNLFIFNDSGADTLTLFYPHLVANSRYLREVGIPGWSFYVGLGSNVYPGFLNSPLNAPYLLFDGEESIAKAIAWVQAGVMIGAGLIFYKFLRVALFSLPVCIIGSLIYTFGGYLVLGSTWYGHSHGIFWMTLAFLGFELILRKKNWWVFPIPFIVLLGAKAYFIILFIGIWALVRILDLYGNSLKEIFGGYKRLIICGVFAVLFSLPFIGGQWHRFAYSPRVSGDVSYSDELSKRSIFQTSDQEHDITAILRLFSNDTVGTADNFKAWRNYLEAPAFYIGLLTLLLVFQFFALTTPRRRILYGTLLGFWVFLIIFPWFRFAFYGFAGNYYKGALSLFIPFSFLYAGLMGLQEIISGRKPNIIVLIGSFLLLMIMLWFPYDHPEVAVSQSIQLKVSLFLIAYLIILGIIWTGAAQKIIVPLLIGVVALEEIIISWPVLNDRIPITKSDIKNKKFHFDYSNEAIAYIKQNEKDPFYRIDKIFGSVKTGFNDAIIQGFYGTKMYQSHNHKNYVRFLSEMGIINGSLEANTRWLIGLSNTQYLHSLFSIKYLLANEANVDKVDNAFYTKIHQEGDVSIYKGNYFIPFGIPFDKFMDYDEFKNLNIKNKKLALYKGIVLEDDVKSKVEGLVELHVDSVEKFKLVASSLDSLASKAMKMEYFNHKKITGSVDVKNPSVVFFSMPYDHGWKAKVDGQPTEILQVDIGMTGIYVTPGTHKIEMVYEPPLSKWGWLGIGAAAIVAFLIHRFRNQFWK